MRIPIIAGNWKMYKTIPEARQLARDIVNGLKTEKIKHEVVLCPPYTALTAVAEIIRESQVKLGAQDVYWEKEGAYTGEVSAQMLKDAGCHYVIIGHSERRTYFNETNETVNKKIISALSEGLRPIVCVGERLEEREKGDTFKVVENHVRGALQGISAEDIPKIVIAYEPVWAIGTGKTATSQQAEEVQSFIRNLLTQLYNDKTADSVRIQYGGSVKPENIKELMSMPNIDGALVGGASLKADSFLKIIKYNL